MAIGGALRAALKAGQWARAASESRRQARLLRGFSADFGERSGRVGPEGALDFLNRQGVDPAYNAPYRDMGGGVREFGGVGGRRVEVGPGGRRYVAAPEMYSPIVSPYEGGRALTSPARMFGRSMETETPPGPWMGRGRGTDWSELPVNGYDGSDGSYFEAYPGPAGFGWPELNNQWSWQRFANSQGLRGMPRVNRYGQIIPFDEIMRGTGSLLGDPRFGPYHAF